MSPTLRSVLMIVVVLLGLLLVLCQETQAGQWELDLGIARDLDANESEVVVDCTTEGETTTCKSRNVDELYGILDFGWCSKPIGSVRACGSFEGRSIPGDQDYKALKATLRWAW